MAVLAIRALLTGCGHAAAAARPSWLVPRIARWWLCAGIVLAAVAPVPAGAATAREYQIKAVFLFNFTQFVIWPSALFVDAQAPLIIGVLGADPYGRYLDETTRGEKVDGRPLVVERYRRVEDVANCHVLFISASEAGNMPAILARLKGRSILTVTDGDVAGEQGGIIRFFTQNNHIRLRIDVRAAKAAGLEVSSKLLRAAEVIGVDGD
jgi:hypothetical protein